MKLQAQHAERKLFLRTVPIFNSLSGRELLRIADRLQHVTFEAEDAMVTEGDDADAMYIIQDGQAVVSQAVDADGDAARSQLRVLKPSDYFGERGLLVDQKRSASVSAASKMSVLRMDKATFRDLLGGLRDLLIQLAPTDRRLMDLMAAKPKETALTSRPVFVLDKFDFEVTSRFDEEDVEVVVHKKPAVRIEAAVEKADDADVTRVPATLDAVASNIALCHLRRKKVTWGVEAANSDIDDSDRDSAASTASAPAAELSFSPSRWGARKGQFPPPPPPVSKLAQGALGELGFWV